MDQGLNVGRIKVNWILLLGALHVEERLSHVRVGGIERPSGTS